jgi:hypothetical protein
MQQMGGQVGMRQYVPLRGMKGMGATAFPGHVTPRPRIPVTAGAFPGTQSGSYGGVPARFKRF